MSPSREQRKRQRASLMRGWLIPQSRTYTSARRQWREHLLTPLRGCQQAHSSCDWSPISPAIPQFSGSRSPPCTGSALPDPSSRSRRFLSCAGVRATPDKRVVSFVMRPPRRKAIGITSCQVLTLPSSPSEGRVGLAAPVRSGELHVGRVSQPSPQGYCQWQPRP